MAGVGAGGIMYSNFEFGSLEEDLDERTMSSSSRDVDRSLEANMTEEEMYRYYSQNDSYYCSNLSACYNESFIDYIGEEEEMYSLGFKIAIAILYNSVFVTALLGNALVCYVVFSSPRMRTVTNYLIANLAVGDLLMAVFCVPFSYIPVLLQYWPFGHFMCYLLPPAQAVSVLVSSYTLVALAADRYIAILYPLRPRFRRSQACWVIAVVWLIAVITASPIAIFTEHYPENGTGRYFCEETGWQTMGAEEFKLPYGLTLMILQYFFPLTVLIFTYSRIAVAVWGKKSLGEAEDSRDQRLAKTKRKTVVMSLCVVAGYTLAWLPINLWVLVGPDRIKWYPQYVFFACHSLAMAHTTYNPVIYAWMNVRFRTAFLSVLSRLPCPCLLKFCFAQNSASANNSQYPFNHNYNTTTTNLYYHQQIYGNSARGSNNKLPLLQQQRKYQGPTNLNQQLNLKKKSTLEFKNGSIKSTLDSDPLVLITIPTSQIQPNTTNIKTTSTIIINNTNINEGGEVIKTDVDNNAKTEQSPPNKHSASNAPTEGNELITSNTNGTSTSPKVIINNLTTLTTSGSPTPVNIMATAKDEDFLDDEDDMEVESPVWT